MSTRAPASPWTTCWSLVVATLVGFSFLVWHPLGVLLVVAVGTFFLVVVGTATAPAQDPDRAPLPPLDVPRLVTRSLCVTTSALAGVVAAAVAPWLAVTLLVLAVATCPRVWVWVSPAAPRPYGRLSRRPPAEESSLS